VSVQFSTWLHGVLPDENPPYLQSAPGTPACMTISTSIQGELNINACT
jgi:hypothetical protein